MHPAVIAAIIAGGGVSSVLSGGQGARRVKEAGETIDTVKAGLEGQREQLDARAQDTFGKYSDDAEGDYQALRDTIESADYDQFAYDETDPFAYDLQAKIKEFMDPSKDLQIKDATQALEGSAANAGKLFSSASGKAIADRAQAMSAKFQKDAMATALQDRNFGYGVYSDDITRARQAKDQGYGMLQGKIGDLSKLTGISVGADTKLGEIMMGNLSGQFTGENQADLTKAQLGLQTPTTGLPAFFSGAGQAGNIIAPFVGGATPKTSTNLGG